MIISSIEGTCLDSILDRSPVFKRARNWIRQMPLDQPDGIVELEGPDVYVNVHGYETKAPQACRWESHRHTIDLQYCIAGSEQIEWLPTGSLCPMGDYDSCKDVEHWYPTDAPATRLRMVPGIFAIFLNGELHRPKITDNAHPNVRKLVVKIRSTLL